MMPNHRQLELDFSAVPFHEALEPFSPEQHSATFAERRGEHFSVGDRVTLIGAPPNRLYKVVKILDGHAVCVPSDPSQTSGKAGSCRRRVTPFWKIRPVCAMPKARTEQTIAEPSSLDRSKPVRANIIVPKCTHPRISIGLDCAHCPDCRLSFKPWTKEYRSLLGNRLPRSPEDFCNQDDQTVPQKTTKDSVPRDSKHTPASGWIEKYLVQGRWEHHRYCWRTGRQGKTHRLHIPRDSGKLSLVRAAIKAGRSPGEIKQLLKSFGEP